MEISGPEVVCYGEMEDVLVPFYWNSLSTMISLSPRLLIRSRAGNLTKQDIPSLCGRGRPVRERQTYRVRRDCAKFSIH